MATNEKTVKSTPLFKNLPPEIINKNSFINKTFKEYIQCFIPENKEQISLFGSMLLVLRPIIQPKDANNRAVITVCQDMSVLLESTREILNTLNLIGFEFDVESVVKFISLSSSDNNECYNNMFLFFDSIMKKRCIDVKEFCSGLLDSNNCIIDSINRNKIPAVSWGYKVIKFKNNTKKTFVKGLFSSDVSKKINDMVANDCNYFSFSVPTFGKKTRFDLTDLTFETVKYDDDNLYCFLTRQINFKNYCLKIPRYWENTNNCFHVISHLNKSLSDARSENTSIFFPMIMDLITKNVINSLCFEFFNIYSIDQFQHVTKFMMHEINGNFIVSNSDDNRKFMYMINNSNISYLTLFGESSESKNYFFTENIDLAIALSNTNTIDGHVSKSLIGVIVDLGISETIQFNIDPTSKCISIPSFRPSVRTSVNDCDVIYESFCGIIAGIYKEGIEPAKVYCVQNKVQFYPSFKLNLHVKDSYLDNFDINDLNFLEKVSNSIANNILI